MPNRLANDWVISMVGLTRRALAPLADPQRAVPMQAYMKDVAPFLGIAAADRRRALRSVWHELDEPTSDDLGRGAQALLDLPEREYHYAACDVIDRFRGDADEFFLDGYVTDLLTTKSWWDTVDGLVTAAVSPLCREMDATWLIEEWSDSGNRWLIRSAITHQRGWKLDTDVPYVLDLCDRHWLNGEFFVAKAIGWALRDIARLDPMSVECFLSEHPVTNRVAIREAERGLKGSAR